MVSIHSKQTEQMDTMDIAWSIKYLWNKHEIWIKNRDGKTNILHSSFKEKFPPQLKEYVCGGRWFKIQKYWPRRDLNTQPSDLESDALPLRHGVTYY